jgi:hypothetical protein
MIGTITALLMVAAAITGYVASRGFVQRRLRFVDAVRSPFAPIVAGGVAFLVALPIAALLPMVTTVTAVFFGAGVAFGTRRGVYTVTATEGQPRYLP